MSLTLRCLTDFIYFVRMVNVIIGYWYRIFVGFHTGIIFKSTDEVKIIIYNLTPDYLSELLTPLSEIHSLNLRSSENGLLHIPLSRTTIFDNSFTCSAPKLWNALPQTVRASGSLVTFKKNLKHCLNS